MAALNLSDRNDKGKLALTSGEEPPEYLAVPALTNAPVFVVRNYQGRSLGLTNVGIQAPIQVAAYAPCYGGNAEPLPADGKFWRVPHGRIRSGQTVRNYMQLVMKAPSLTVFGIFFGTDSMVYCVADFKQPPTSCQKSTQRNRMTVTDNWQGMDIYIVNLSAKTAPPAEVALINLLTLANRPVRTVRRVN